MADIQERGMPTRTKYIHDPDYEHIFEHAFGTKPDRPAFEIFIPVEAYTQELHHAMMRPIWLMEQNYVWPKIMEEMAASNVRGDFIEFGVMTGYGVRKYYDLFSASGVITHFYGFDSFQGLPKPHSEKDSANWREGTFRGTKEKAWELISDGLDDTSAITLVEGWFNETLSNYTDVIKQIAFLRIDCDLYQSTVDALEFGSGRLVDNAIIYFDDWEHDHRTGEARAFFEFAERHAGKYRFEKIVTVSDGSFAVRTKLI